MNEHRAGTGPVQATMLMNLPGAALVLLLDAGRLSASAASSNSIRLVRQPARNPAARLDWVQLALRCYYRAFPPSGVSGVHSSLGRRSDQPQSQLFEVCLRWHLGSALHSRRGRGGGPPTISQQYEKTPCSHPSLKSRNGISSISGSLPKEIIPSATVFAYHTMSRPLL